MTIVGKQQMRVEIQRSIKRLVTGHWEVQDSQGRLAYAGANDDKAQQHVDRVLIETGRARVFKGGEFVADYELGGRWTQIKNWARNMWRRVKRLALRILGRT